MLTEEQKIERVRAWKRKYYEKNRDKVIARAAARAAANPDKERERNRIRLAEWRKANPEAAKKKDAAWRKAHPDRSPEQRDRHNEVSRKWYARNKEKHLATARKWSTENPQSTQQHNRNRRARKADAPGRHTPGDIARLFECQRGKCAACSATITQTGKGKRHVDHVVPLSRGGSNDPANLQLLCPTCNLRKGSKHPDNWAAEIGRLFI